MSNGIFSATGNILKSPCECDVWVITTQMQDIPDRDVNISKKALGVINGNKYVLIGNPSSSLTVCSWVPGLSIGSGICRAFLGLVHAIVHLVAAVWNMHDLNVRNAHLKEAKFGAIQIGQGISEIIPFVGIAIFMMNLNTLYADCEEKIRNRTINIRSDEVVRIYYGKELTKSFPKCTYFKPKYLR